MMPQSPSSQPSRSRRYVACSRFGLSVSLLALLTTACSSRANDDDDSSFDAGDDSGDIGDDALADAEDVSELDSDDPDADATDDVSDSDLDADSDADATDDVSDTPPDAIVDADTTDLDAGDADAALPDVDAADAADAEMDVIEPPRPDAYERNVLLDVFTGSWCGWCTDGQVFWRDLAEMWGDRLNVVESHNGDPMETEFDVSLQGLLGASAYPSGSIDRVAPPGETRRVVSRGDWATAVENRISTPAPCGVSVDATDLLAINVDVECLDGHEDLMLQVYLVQDEVTGTGTGYNQVNYLNSTAGHPYEGAGDPIVGFVHRRVIVDTSTDTALGTPFALTDGRATLRFDLTAPTGVEESNLSVLAVLTQFAEPDLTPVLNTNEAPAGEAVEFEGIYNADPVYGGFGECPATSALIDTYEVVVDDAGPVRIDVDTIDADSVFEMRLYVMDTPGMYTAGGVAEVLSRNATCTYPSPTDSCPNVNLSPGTHEVGIVVRPGAEATCLGTNPPQYVLVPNRIVTIEPALDDTTFPFDP